MPHSSISYGLLSVLAIALLWAAATDLKSRTIANGLNLAIALAAPLFWWANGLAVWPDCAIQLGFGLGVFAVATGIYAIGQMGGGDVKLLGALALWFSPLTFINLAMIMAALGFVLTLAMGARAVVRSANGASRGELLVLVAPAVVAVILAAGLFGGLGAKAAAMLGISGNLSPIAAFALIQVPVVVLAVASLAAIRLMRRREVTIEAPYGVAIALGGLCVIGGNLLAGLGKVSGIA